MTIEIRELIVKVEVAESSPLMGIPAEHYSQWDEERLLEKLRREMLEFLRERGSL